MFAAVKRVVGKWGCGPPSPKVNSFLVCYERGLQKEKGRRTKRDLKFHRTQPHCLTHWENVESGNLKCTYNCWYYCHFPPPRHHFGSLDSTVHWGVTCFRIFPRKLGFPIVPYVESLHQPPPPRKAVRPRRGAASRSGGPLSC